MKRRDIQKTLEGLSLECLETRRRNHVVMTLRNAFGLVRKITVPVSPSCNRARQNLMADLKRFSKMENLK